MEIDDDCIPFKKEKIFSKMSWVKNAQLIFAYTKRIDTEHMFCYNRNIEFTNYRIGKEFNYGRIKDVGLLKRIINYRSRRD